MDTTKGIKSSKSFLNTKKIALKLYRQHFGNYRKENNTFNNTIEKFQTLQKAKKVYSKSPEIANILKSHVSLKETTKITNLPKLPFGVHLTYNEDDNFSSHFSDDNSDSSREYRKKRRFLEKELYSSKMLLKNRIKGNFRDMQDMHIYKTSAGKLFCKLQKNVIQSYLTRNPIFRSSNNPVAQSTILSPKIQNNNTDLVSVSKSSRQIRYPTPF
jgi:hypothetical protein